MQDIDEKIRNMHTGRLVRMLNHQLKRNQKPEEAVEDDELTPMQRHILNYILLETLHRDIYQKNLEEEFQVRKSTVSGILKLIEKKRVYLPGKRKRGCQTEKNPSHKKSRGSASKYSGAYS